MPLAKLFGGDIHYEINGHPIRSQSTPVIILKPLSRGPVGVQPFISLLSENFTVINYDQRGLGQSQPPLTSGPVSMKERATEIFELLDSLSINKVHLVCHSTGCGIGLSMTDMHPKRVSSIVLISPWTHADNHLLKMQNLRVSAAKALEPLDYFRFNISLLYPTHYRQDHEQGFSEMELVSQNLKVDSKFISEGLIPILEFDSREITHKVKCPALISFSTDDQLMPPWFGKSIAKDIPGAELLVFKNGGHMVPETCTVELASGIIKFIKEYHP
jgi:pimeloyl-ACP methyl ester carboxylesterase